MKINEFKSTDKEQLDELRLSSIIGDTGSAFVKSMFSGKGMKQQMIQDIFLKDFYEDAITSLDNGIGGGIVNPNLRGTFDGGETAEENPSEVEPAPGEPGAPAPAPSPGGVARPTTAAAVAARKAQQQTTQNINNYIKGAAATLNKTTDKNQKIALTKELVNAMADRQGTPEWDNALATVQQIIKRGGVDPGFANAAIGNLKAGKTMSEAWRIYFANKLVEAVGLTWNDLGLCVIRENKKLYIAERKYIKLNSLFESIALLQEAGNQQSVGQYLYSWFNQYMQGVNWQAQDEFIRNQIANIENSYPRGYKELIKKLAKTAFALSKTGSPAGMKDELAKLPGQNAQQNQQKTPEELKAELDKLRSSDPAAYTKLVSSLSR